MIKLPEELPYIDPRCSYPIGAAAKLVFVCRDTLRRDALAEVLPSTRSKKNGRLRFRGKDLIYYRDYVR